MQYTRNTLKFKDKNKLKVKVQKQIYYLNSNQKRAGVTIPTSDKIIFKTKMVTRDKGHFIMTKGSICQKG